LDNLDNYRLMLSLKDKTQPGIEFKTPFFYLNGSFINSEGNIHDKLRMFILEGLKKQNEKRAQAHISLVEYFKRFAPLAVIIAGLQDGFNPCAFTVIVFFISFLAVQGYRRRDLILIGSSFILAVFLTYLGIGLGIFNFFYRFKDFWILTRLLNLTIGSLSILFGILAIWDFIKFKKTGSSDGLILQLPKPIKERIHKVVGFFYRRSPQEKQDNLLPAPGKLVVSAFVTGFLVSVLEAVCVAQIYLPTIIFILKTTGPKLRALGYLLLYNLLFVAPLLVIFCFALAGTSVERFQRVLRGRLGIVKILMGMTFLGMGIFLVWRA
jgi:cytochrome c biogenesis protein CcdA